jgi:tetratricopeptide (TPR) repeat protein
MRTCLFFAGVSVLVATAVFAQDAAHVRDFVVRGEISPSTALTGGYTLEVRPPGGIGESVPIHADGSFEFRSTREGPQELRVVGPGGAIVYQETVFVSAGHQPIEIQLADAQQGSASRAAGGTVTLQQLQHKVPPEAKKAFDHGEQLAAQGKSQESLEAFRQAVTLDPEYSDAFNELGAAEAGAGNLAAAADAFQKAVDVAPEHPFALPNLSIVLAQLGRYQEAIDAARRALKVVPNSGRVHYILAASLLITHGDIDEALDHLERAASEVPKAHLAAADVLIFRGRDQEAAKHLEEFLKVAPPDDKERPNAEARLATIRIRF